MDKKLVLILALLLIVNLPIIKITNAQTTVVYVNPQLTTRDQTGETFQINVSISQVTDLAAWEFKMYYESSVLNATSFAQGPFLKTAGNTSLVPLGFTDSYNATHGRIWFACILIGEGPGASGNGTLATITFKVKGLGVANLHLAYTDLLDSALPDPNHIPHTTIDGIFQTVGHDIALTKVTPLENVVGQGFVCRINVTVENHGYFTETFNVTLYADARTVATISNIVLARAIRANITFTWNTTYFDRGNYVISAYAWPVQGEIDMTDNNCTGGSVQITKVGDLGSRVGSKNVFGVCDGLVTSTDLQLFLQCYKGMAPSAFMYLGDLGSRVGSTNVFFACDGLVTSTDLQLFLQCYKGLYARSIYIRADGSIDPPTAPIQRDGDLYFLTGNVASNVEGVVIERSGITLDGAGYTIQGIGLYASKGVDLSGRINVTIKNMKIEVFSYGVWLYESFGISISGNNITENGNCGIWLWGSSDNTVTGNSVIGNNAYGIFLEGSPHNTVSRNNITENNGYGLVLNGSSSYNNTVTGNSVIGNNAYGIFLEGSSNKNTVSGNNIENDWGGMLVFGFSNTVSGNNIIGNNGYGIIMNGSSNTLSSNNVTENGFDGIEIWSFSNTVSGNNIVANTFDGIYLYSASNNTISLNNIIDNKVGIYLHSSSGNSIYHNDFVNNLNQVFAYNSVNVWNNSYPSGGNYWSDYNDVDLYKGPSQNEPGSDGIGDRAYFIDTYNQDNYPFMHVI